VAQQEFSKADLGADRKAVKIGRNSERLETAVWSGSFGNPSVKANDQLMSTDGGCTRLGPAAALVGWIPYRGFLGPLPGDFAKLPLNLGIASSCLFATGNPVPIIHSEVDFWNVVGSKEFRVAVSLRNVEAVFEDGRDAVITWAPPTVKDGFTPFNVAPPPFRQGVGQPAQR
jgi:hypothetical protein